LAYSHPPSNLSKNGINPEKNPNDKKMQRKKNCKNKKEEQKSK
jgi:hypothetical protein